jgi:hypothetical protein
VKLPRLGEVFPSQARLFAVELAESGEVQGVGDLELAGLEQEEGGDQMWVAADDAELAAELLPRVTPLPPPVREAAVETVPNHEDVSCSEHQIRLSKGLVAKFVQSLELGSAICHPGRCACGAGCWARSAVAHSWICGRPETHNKLKKPPQWWLLSSCFYD